MKKIWVDHKLVRAHTSTVNREWQKEQLDVLKYVMIIGQRTLSNGKIHTESEFGYVEKYYEGKEYFQAYLVVESLRSKPFYVFKED